MSYKDLMAALKADMNGIVETADGEGRDLTDQEVETINEKIAEYKRYEELEGKAAGARAFLDGMKDAPSPEKDDMAGLSIGERVAKARDFAAYVEANRNGVSEAGENIYLSAKNVGTIRDHIGRKANITTETGQIPVYREPGYRNYLDEDDRLVFLDLITTGTTNFPYAEYAQIVSENDNAAIVPEGQLKPESDLDTAKKESKAYTYADGFTITNQTLADDGALAAFMQSRIVRHIRGVIADKVLNGAGSGTEPEGILNTTGTLAQAFDTDVITTLARALDTYEKTNKSVGPQAIVMNPADVWGLRLLKDQQGRYLLGNPLEQGPIPTPWGVPLVQAAQVKAGTALVGRFDSVHWLELEPLSVVAFNQHKDYAQRNLTYVRAETRGRQLFYSPRELVVATISGS